MKKLLVLVFLVISFFLDFGLIKVLAATGSIIGSSAYAWGENMGWINFLANGGNISVTDSTVTGYAWNSNYGWINLSPSTGGVTNNCSGILGGKAWSETLGWIDFSGVKIDSNGKFVGTIGTSGSTVGRINFDCANCNVKTDWQPTCGSTTISSTTSASAGWAAPACSATKPGSAPIITNTVNGSNSVTLTWSKAKDPLTKYLVAYGTSPGSIEFGNPNVGNADTTSYTIKGLSGGTRYYFKVKAINGCMPGDWSNEVSSIIVGGTSVVTTTAEGFVPASEISNRLLDIALIIDKPQINNVSELTARVTFVSFGREDTPVEMTFTIVDEKGKEYYRSVDNTVIQTEGVFNKTFEGLKLDKGKYKVVLNTLYNTNIRDEFKQDFEVGKFTTSTTSNFLSNKPLILIIGSGIILLLISWIIGLMRRKKKKKV
ncbi:MAG: fibronectin type III domain-containing protein [Candidatus Shapirobacteria bacterium]|nr:fibronectin type III domain-containing protein [Candidatus Shapirobacteria bacterium]